MSAEAPELPERLIAEYRDRLTPAVLGRSGQAVDELIRGLAAEHEPYAALAGAVESLGLEGLLAARRQARRLVEDDGVTYGPGSEGHQGHGWVIDPLPLVIDPAEWQAVEDGVQQRARLLDLVLSDLYGERELLHSRAIPAELILAHPGFLPTVDGIRHPGSHQLTLTAADLARRPNGEWAVLADRIQVPSGSAYAMANRRITSRVMAGLHRATPLVRLRGWFEQFTSALTAIAPSGVELPRVAILSPGVESETAFEMAFLSTLLGIPTVKSEDLTTRGGRVSIRAGERIEKVDVLLRRVDAAYCDPLDLRADSKLGVVGLVEAARLGNLSVANPLGAGVLENPALLPYLERLAPQLLGEELMLPSVPAWWCGEPAGRSHVLANLEDLVIKPIAREWGPVRFGWELSAAQRDELRAQIEARPSAWAAQEPLDASSAPVVTRRGLEPRQVLLRTFSVAPDGAYVTLPGGLARAAAFPGQQLVSNMSGALAKDVWVLARPGSERPLISLGSNRSRLLPERVPVGLAARVADNLFWLGRYAERAESTARLLRVTSDLAEDHAGRPGTPGAAAMRTVAGALSQLCGGASEVGSGDEILRQLRDLALNGERVGTLAWAIGRLVAATNEVRDQLSLDTWIVLGRLERTLADIPGDEVHLQASLGRLLEPLLAVAGISAESMVRDATWGLIETGVRLERAIHTLGLLRHTLGAAHAPVVEGQVVEAVLTACESIITHRRRNASGVGPALPAESAVNLLLLDASNPRSVAFQIEKLCAAMELLDDSETAMSCQELKSLVGQLELDPLFAGDRADLPATLTDLEQRLRELSDGISARHFTRPAPQHSVQLPWSTAGSN